MIKLSDCFVVRTPLLPFGELLGPRDILDAPAACLDPTTLEPTQAHDCAKLRARVRDLLARNEVREALFIASPSLHDSLDLWLREPETERGQKIERALLRYLARMAGRATPFGLFAGCSVGTIGDRTQLLIQGQSAYQRHTRLDGDYLSELTDKLAQDPALQDLLTYHPNSSLYRSAGRLRYVEARLAARKRTYHLVALVRTPYLDATLDRAAQGATLATLASALIEDDGEVEMAEAIEYIRDLVARQILVPELAPMVTGQEPIHDIIAQLGNYPERTPAGPILAQTRDDLAALDAAGVGADPQRYRDLAQRLQVLPAEVKLPRLFQIDLAKPAPEATLGPEVLKEVLHAVDVLHRISGGATSRDALARFQEDFVKRYEDREVPLVEALDEEAGIGFADSSREATPLLAGLVWPARGERPTVPWGKRENFLLRKLQEASHAQVQQITLGPDDLKQMEVPDRLPLPESFALTGTVLAAGQSALAAGKFQLHVHGISGPSGANLLGRFCHLDEALTRHMERYLRAEEAMAPDAIFAEIVHLPEGRTGNILLRPLLREFEIPYLGRSGAPLEKQIPLDDLLLSISGGRIVLRSARLGREVVPRLTTAHNFSSPTNLAVYRFLCALQGQDTSRWLGFSWGALDGAPFLPRVVSGKLILSPARWRLSESQLKSLGESHTRTTRFLAMQKLRAELRLPRLVALAEGDNLLPLDLDNVLSIETGIHLMKEDRQTVLVEMLAGPDQLCVFGPEGAFVHELVVPLLRTRDVDPAPPSVRAAAPAGTDRRSFPPGSEWLYAKLYTGTATADQVLRELVRPLVDDALSSGAADGWFFIRYSDPEWHIRLRFHGQPRRLSGELLPALHEAMAPFLANGRIWRCQMDTYQRELERYGGPAGIVLAERIFQVDSEAVLALLQELSGDDGADARWRLALCGVDHLLNDLGLDLAGKRAVVQQAREGLKKELRVNVPFERQLGDKYRKERARLEALRNASALTDDPLAPSLAILGRRRERLAPIIAELRTCEQARGLLVPIASLAGSYLHMYMNRLLRAAARAQELVIYDFLRRLYDSQVARMRASSS